MRNYVIWGSRKHGQYCLALDTDLNNIFGEGKLPYTARQMATMTLPNDDAAVFMYKRYFDALHIQEDEEIPGHVGLPVWSRTNKEEE